MFLQLNHQQLDVYSAAKQFAHECYRFTRHLPPEERFNMVQQIRRAALSVVLNIAEGASRKSEVERKRFFEISRGSLIEIDAAFDVAESLGYFSGFDQKSLSELVNRTFSMLTKLLHH
ncbi:MULTISPECIES: four helix bundle protein [Chitinophagaceae]|uniref:four helix bundle protein n=1 Tax=Chitinophagaceae TaxID=563835 RepID=UPI000DEF1926|nr:MULTISPECIES: four helix bundle protein [Chitinophagaceae]RPD43724.1 four helix bundle protein [Paracnuella aquatica]